MAETKSRRSELAGGAPGNLHPTVGSSMENLGVQILQRHWGCLGTSTLHSGKAMAAATTSAGGPDFSAPGSQLRSLEASVMNG